MSNYYGYRSSFSIKMTKQVYLKYTDTWIVKAKDFKDFEANLRFTLWITSLRKLNF